MAHELLPATANLQQWGLHENDSFSQHGEASRAIWEDGEQWCLPIDVGRRLSTHQVPGFISIFPVMSTDIVSKSTSPERAMWLQTAEGSISASGGHRHLEQLWQLGNRKRKEPARDGKWGGAKRASAAVLGLP